MLRFCWIGMALVLFSCGQESKEVDEEGSGFSYENFSRRFKSINPPYALSDTGLLKNKDTATLRNAEFISYLPDSLKKAIFGKTARPKLVPLVQIKLSDETSLFFVKAEAGNKKAALIYAFDEGKYSSVFPFLVPDNDATTSQISSIDKVFAITRSVTQRRKNALTADGRDVFDYDASLKQFTLILTNPLHASNEVINPIDTFSRKHKFTGDYVKDKRNFISVRDGRNPNQLLVFAHIDKNKGACTGELKGEILLTSGNTAIYRQGGDPCVMTFRFGTNSVSIKEDEGCGSHRGIECVFDGSYPKKKSAKSKTSTKKTK